MKLYTLPIHKSKKVTLVDEDTYKKYKNERLVLNIQGYVYLASTNEFLHRKIMNLTKLSPIYVDHKNRDILNNTRDNLRLAYQSQNIANSKKRSNCSSPYKGVWVQHTKGGPKYNVEITLYYNTYRLGRFTDEIEAALTYDKAALFFFGDFARINFPNKVKQHAKLKVRYVDFAHEYVIFPTEEDLRKSAEDTIENKVRSRQLRLEERESSFKDNIKPVINKKLGKVLKIKIFGNCENKFFYCDRKYYKILCKYKFYYINNRITGINIHNQIKPIYTILKLRYRKYEHQDNNKFNCCSSNIFEGIVKVDTDEFYKKIKNNKNSSSKYTGVRVSKEGNYRVCIETKGKQIGLGTYSNEEYAAKVYDTAVRRFNCSKILLNFPNENNEYIKLPIDKDYIKPPQLICRSSKYAGITKDKKIFIAKLGKFELGRFTDEIQAAIAVTYAARLTGLYHLNERWLNFDKKTYRKLNKLTLNQKKHIKRTLKGVRWA